MSTHGDADSEDETRDLRGRHARRGGCARSDLDLHLLRAVREVVVPRVDEGVRARTRLLQPRAAGAADLEVRFGEVQLTAVARIVVLVHVSVVVVCKVAAVARGAIVVRLGDRRVCRPLREVRTLGRERVVLPLERHLHSLGHREKARLRERTAKHGEETGGARARGEGRGGER